MDRPSPLEMRQYTCKTLKAIPELERVSIQDPSESGFTAKCGYPIELSLRGPDWDTLGNLSQELKDAR